MERRQLGALMYGSCESHAAAPDIFMELAPMYIGVARGSLLTGWTPLSFAYYPDGGIKRRRDGAVSTSKFSLGLLLAAKADPFLVSVMADGFSWQLHNAARIDRSAFLVGRGAESVWQPTCLFRRCRC